MDTDRGDEKGKGIKEQIKRANVYTYSKLTKEKFVAWSKDLLYSPFPGKNMTVFTGWFGMILFDLQMLGLSIDMSIRVNFIETSRVPNLRYYISLFKKSGNVKVKIVRKYDDWVFECYNNTKYLFTCKELNEFVIKALKSINVEETVKQYTNAELLEMRQWVRENFTPRIDDVDPNWHKVMKDEASRMAEEQDREADEVNFNED